MSEFDSIVYGLIAACCVSFLAYCYVNGTVGLLTDRTKQGFRRLE